MQIVTSTTCRGGAEERGGGVVKTENCHSERKRRISKKRIRFFVTQFLRMTGKKVVILSVSEESKIMHYELQLTILPSASGCHPPLHKEGK